MLGQHLVLVTLYRNVQIILSKALELVTLNILSSVATSLSMCIFDKVFASFWHLTRNNLHT